MKFVGLSLAVAGTVAASEFHAIVQSVKESKANWTSVVPERFGSLADVRTVCGTRLRGDSDFQEESLVTPSPYDARPLKNIPDSFDARTQWPKCTVISKIRDQSSCGSCWAFSATETFEDSRCIATGEDIEFSADDTAGCCKGFLCGLSMGCGGGQQVAALHWMTDVGVVTGGDYVSNANNSNSLSEGCKPYELAPCAHHVPPSAKYPKCPGEEYSIHCKKECSNSAYSTSYSQDKKKGAKAHSLSTIEGMQTALIKTGPLAVAFTVYGDFPTYKSGVYKHTSGEALGGHAVTMIGWGTENGEDYWLVKNSWNEQWGDGGTFKIARGNDECGIESSVGSIAFQ